MLRASLFLKIYLTLLASLLVLALAGAAVIRLSWNGEERGWSARRDAILAGMLPEGVEPADTQLVLDRLGVAFEADLAIYSNDGLPLASTGAPLPFAKPQGAEKKRDTAVSDLLVERLPGERVLVARLAAPFGPGRGNMLGLLAIVGLTTAAASWPVARMLTRRLERLRRGVEAWGEGRLASRVAVEGRDEVAAVAQSFNLAAEHVEKLVVAHRSLLANASHELRSPLARLRMAIDLYDTGPSVARKLEIVQNLAELDELVEEILLASKLTHAEKPKREDCVDLLALAAEEGARFGISPTGASVAVVGNRLLLARLLRNLIQNAIRHGAPPVLVEVISRDGIAEFVVQDHGAGVPGSERERVFEPFYRPSGRGEVAGGWGLGLALVRQIAVGHGGTVRYEAPENGGARFVVTLPIELSA